MILRSLIDFFSLQGRLPDVPAVIKPHSVIQRNSHHCHASIRPLPKKAERETDSNLISAR